MKKLRSMKLQEAAKKVEDGIDKALTYCDFLSEHWSRIRTNNVIERLNREIRRRTRVVGSFPDGNSALMLVCAQLRHVADPQWGNKKYMSMKPLEAAVEDASIAGDFIHTRGCKPFCEKSLTLPVEKLIPGIITLSARQKPQKTYHQTLGTIWTESRLRAASSIMTTAKAIASASQLPLGSPCIPASRNREGSIPNIRPINRHTDDPGYASREKARMLEPPENRYLPL